MGIWRVDADVLARGRFAVSALAETVAAIAALHFGAPVGVTAWAARYAPAYRRHLARDRFAARLVDAALQPRSIPDFLVVPPLPGDRTFRDEIRRVRATPAAVAQADLARGLGGRLPSDLAVPDLPQRAADLLEWTWTHTVRPDWPRRRRVFEADIVARTQQLSRHGWAAALGGMRPNMRWLGDGRLRINAYDNPPRELTDAELLFIPSTARRGWVCWDEPHRYAVVYPCSGLLADADSPAVPGALGRLLGPARGTVLTLLDTPRSTTQLVALTGFGLGSVGGHLKVLLDAGLVSRRRSGRSVLYYRTGAGDALVRGARG